MRSVSIIMGLLLPTYCLLAPPHPKGFVIVIIPVNISIKIIPDCYLVNRSDSFFQLDHLLSLKVGYKKAGSKMPRRPFLEISSNLFDNRPWDIERLVVSIVRRIRTFSVKCKLLTITTKLAPTQEQRRTLYSQLRRQIITTGANGDRANW